MVRIAMRVVAIVVALAMIFIGIGLPLYVFPSSDAPAEADAVVVLGPSRTDRVALAHKLVAEGYAPRVYLSMPPDMARLSECYAADTSCFSPKPSTTRGEALFVHEQARAHGWSSVIVITSGYHLSRARVILDACGGVRAVHMVEAHEPLSPKGWVYQYLYQTAGFVKAAIVGCAR